MRKIGTNNRGQVVIEFIMIALFFAGLLIISRQAIQSFDHAYRSNEISKSTTRRLR